MGYVMRMFQVGSSIHGDLLSPNDIDIAIETDSVLEYENLSTALGASEPVSDERDFYRIATARNGDRNFILLHNITAAEYSKGMDVNVVRGYKDLSSGSLTLFKEAKQGLKNKQIIFLKRSPEHEKLFKNYGSVDKERVSKYSEKLPDGWELIVRK